MVKRKRNIKIYKENKIRKKIFFVFKLLGSIFSISVLFLSFLFIYYTKDLPQPEDFTEKSFIQPTRIYDREGKVLLCQIYGEEKRDIIPLNQMSNWLIKAVIATEDANFYHHHGIDIKGMLRAMLIDLKSMKPVEGGSTISQQLIRSTFLSRKKTIKRKIKEIVLTLELERKYSKNQILEWYLNQIPFGINIYGTEAASQTYFGKHCKDLTIAESATLAALIQSPSYLYPYGHHRKELLERKNYVLERMFREHFLSQDEYNKAKQEKIKFIKNQKIKAPQFVNYVEDYLFKKYGKNFLEQKGYKIYTSLDWNLQNEAQNIIKDKMIINERKYHAFNASLVAIDPNTGQILAMIGSKDSSATSSYPPGCIPGKTCLFDPDVNIATYGKGRQPGSSFKPFAYVTAFKKGYTPDTVVWDVKTNFGVFGSKPYIPENYDGKFRGPITLRNALAQSINIPAVKVIYLAGVKNTIETAKNMGITTLNKNPDYYGLSLVLGGGSVRLLDMVSAYGVFATNGLRIPPVSILKIEDSNGNVIEENQKNPKIVLENNVCSLINSILSDNNARAPMFGKNSALYLKNYQVAAKTGTTDNFRDAWVIGYTSSIVTGVWVGNNNNAPMAKEPGVILAGPIWHEFMKKALIKYPPKRNLLTIRTVKTNKPILNGYIDWLNPHSILYYVDKDNPQKEGKPKNPLSDPQYKFWEKGIKEWIKNHPSLNTKKITK